MGPSARMAWAMLSACCAGLSAAQPDAAAQGDPPAEQRGAPAASAPAPEQAESPHAGPGASPNPPAAEQPRSAITAEDAAAIVLQAYGGRIIQQAPATSAEGKPGHRLRVDVNGRIKTVFVDVSGRLTEQPARQRDAPADR